MHWNRTCTVGVPSTCVSVGGGGVGGGGAIGCKRDLYTLSNGKYTESYA